MKALIDSGYEMESERPEVAITAAMKRRSNNYGDIVQIKYGEWGLREWYSQKELKAFDHKARTIAGMDAARARGVKIGSAMKLTEGDAVIFKEMVASGTKIGSICEKFGIAYATFHNYRKRLESWNPGDPYPPPKPEKKKTESDDDDVESGDRSGISKHFGEN